MLKQSIAGLAFTAAVLAAGAAGAADLRAAPVYKAPPAPIAPIFSWTGFYIGANIGGGVARPSATVGDISVSQDLTGVVGGGQIGYNWQFDSWILGVEGDFSGTSEHRTVSATDGVNFASVDNSVPWFATIRGRLGYAIAPMWMIYATGGGAWQDFKSNITFNGASATFETSHGGWTAGGGIEAAFDRNWSWRLEYLHLDTGSINNSIVGVPVSARLTNDIGRFGINYRF